MYKLHASIFFSVLCSISTYSLATPVTTFQTSDWILLDAEDGFDSGGYVGPGWGGQDFDAEYLYARLDGNILSLGLQTGFDLMDGTVKYGNRDYYAGDLALSFDGDKSHYEFAIDFGLFTLDYDGDKVDSGSGTGIDMAGVYQVNSWNDDIYFDQSSPYAMSGGSKITDLMTNTVGKEGDSYFRVASFDLTALSLDSYDLHAHWTMSCGNDVLEMPDITPTSFNVPEPSPLPLLGLGTLALLLLRKQIPR